jgi:hypothetical protein
VRHGEAGQGAEYTGLLAVVALVVAVTAGGMGGAIADGAGRAVCAIVGDGSQQAERTQPQVQRLTGERLRVRELLARRQGRLLSRRNAAAQSFRTMRLRKLDSSSLAPGGALRAMTYRGPVQAAGG